MDWKDQMENLDVKKLKDYNLPVLAKRFEIKGEYVDIPDFNEYSNMIVALSYKLTMSKINEFAEAVGKVMAKTLKPMLEKISKLEKESVDLSSISEMQEDIKKIKQELFPKDFLKEFDIKTNTNK